MQPAILSKYQVTETSTHSDHNTPHSPDQSKLAKLASVLLSFSQEETIEEESELRADEEIPALSLTRLSPAPTGDNYLDDTLRVVEGSSSSSIRAYAKLQGRSWEFYINKLSIILGRSPDIGSASSSGVDVFLGTSEGISKKHLRIEYNQEEKIWELFCFGRSGVNVNDTKYEPFCQPVPLDSRSLIKVEDVDFYFLLPVDNTVNNISKIAALDPRARISKGRKRKLIKANRKSSDTTITTTTINANTTSRKKDDDDDDEIDENSLESSVQISISDSEVQPSDLTKPPLSYACLIAEAINSTTDKKLTLSGIYKYLADKYPYFKFTKSGWQNSIRHNLSLNKAFRKVPRSTGEPGKGMFWVIDPVYKHLVETPGMGRRTAGRNRTLAASNNGGIGIGGGGGGGGGGGQSSTPTSPPLLSYRQPISMQFSGIYVPILPTRPVPASPVLAPQLLEAVTAMDKFPSSQFISRP